MVSTTVTPDKIGSKALTVGAKNNVLVSMATLDQYMLLEQSNANMIMMMMMMIIMTFGKLIPNCFCNIWKTGLELIVLKGHCTRLTMKINTQGVKCPCLSCPDMNI